MNLHKPPILPPLGEEESGNAIRVRDRPVDQLMAEEDQKGVVGAALLPLRPLGTAPVGAVQPVQFGCQSVPPGGRGVGKNVDPRRQAQQDAGREQRHEIDDGRLAGEAAEQEPPCGGGHFALQLAQHGQPAGGKAGVVQVAAAVAATKTAIGSLRVPEIARMAVTHVRRKALGSGRQS